MTTKRGRPTLYTEALVHEVCERMAAGESLRQICTDEHMPSDAAVRGWAIDDVDGFAARYARAREAYADAIFDEAIEIADDSSGDWTEDKDGKKVVDHENVQRSRLRVDTRKWAAAKLAPKKYSDKLSIDAIVRPRSHEDALDELAGPVRDALPALPAPGAGSNGAHEQALDGLGEIEC